MIGHVEKLSQDQRRELLALLTQERADRHTDDELLTELSDALRRQLSLSETTDLTEGFRRRMIRVTDELGEDHAPSYYDFRSDLSIAKELLTHVSQKVNELSATGGDDFKSDFAKSFKTMSQDKRANWLHEAALAADAVRSSETDAPVSSAKQKSSGEATAAQIVEDVAFFSIAYSVARDAAVRNALAVARSTGFRTKDLVAAAGPLGLVAGGAVAFAIRRAGKKQSDAVQVRRAAQKQRDAVQVRRERQATQAVVTTCVYILGAIDPEEFGSFE